MDFVLAKTLFYEHADRRMDSQFGYYHKVKLSPHDSHLVVGSLHFTHHCAGEFSPVLLTRIKAFGLGDACTQIAGRFVDYPRTFLCVALGDVKEYGGSPSEPEPIPGEDWGLLGPPRLKELNSDDDEDELEPFSTAHDLFPLKNGQPQLPPPETCCGFHDAPRSPSIRTFDFRNAPVMTCKYNSCTIAVWHINNFSFSEWCRVTETTNPGATAIVEPLETLGTRIHLNLIFFDSSKHDREIDVHFPGFERCDLADLYRTVLSYAINRGAKHIAFPALLAWASKSEMEKVYMEAAMVIRCVVEHVGQSSYEEEAPERIQVHFVLDDVEVWRAFVAATNLLAYWELNEKLRRKKEAGLLDPLPKGPRLELKSTFPHIPGICGGVKP